MNVNSSTSSQILQSASSGSSKTNSLSTQQKAIVEDVLSKYDTNSLSANDAMEIVESFQEAGIAPSQALASTMEASGFDAKEVGDLAGIGGGKPMGGPPPPPPQEDLDSVSSLLESLLSSDDEDEDDTTTSSISSSSSSFDAILDYTTKIMSLKDGAQEEVMSLLEQYNSDSNTLSQEDTEKFIVNSLSQILNESDNYNTMSFYA